MSVRIRILVTLILVAVGLAPVMFMLHRAVLMPRFAQIDQNAAQRDMERVVQALARECEHLGLLCIDWAVWDDAYRFARGENDSFVDDNLAYDTFDNARLDLIGIYDDEGGEVWAQVWDHTTDTLVAGTGNARTVPALADLVAHSNAESSVAGLMPGELGLLIIASHPILQTNGAGPTAGTMVMGRRVDEALVETLSHSTRVSVRMVEGHGAPQSHASARLVESEAVWPGCSIEVHGLHDGAVATAAELPGLDGSAALRLEASSPATVTTEGRRAIAAGSVALVLLVILYAVVTGVILERVVGRRIWRLSTEVEGICLDGDSVSWVTVDGHDEITALGQCVNRTLSALQEAVLALKASQARMATLFNSSAVGSAILDAEGRYVYVSDRWAEMLGRAVDDLERKPLNAFAHPEDGPSLVRAFDAIIAGPSNDFRLELRYTKESGTVVWVDCAARAIRASGGELEAAICIYVDVDDRRRAEEQLRALSLHDPLTGLPNRRAFDDHFDREWRVAMRIQHPLSLLMVDIDHFKLYNDTLGHPAGDERLKDVAGVIRSALLRATDFAARWGGEEFAVIISGAGGAEGTEAAERLRKAVEDAGIPHPTEGPGHITVSVGVATLKPPPGADKQDVIEAADRALYQAKSAGRNCWSVIEL